MILRLLVLFLLGSLASAGPVTWDDSKCSDTCTQGRSSKYQYSEDKSYIYSYESSNELQADKASDLSVKLKAIVTLTIVSKCEAVLKVSSVELQHGSQSDSSSSLVEELERNVLPFSWDDGRISHVCPNPSDSDQVNNIKKAILSTFQNTMRTFEHDAFNEETDILGSCDTEYKTKEIGVENYEITKTKNIPTCSNHLKGQTLLLSSFYTSAANKQHLPFLSDEKATCKQIIKDGIVEKVICDEDAYFKPLSEYGYVVHAIGKSKIEMLSSEPAPSASLYKTPKKESLVFKYNIRSRKTDTAESEARVILKHICDNSRNLITKDAASYVHKLVYTIREMKSESSVENVYQALKKGEICNSGKKAQSIYLDALRFASSGGSISLLSKLAISGEMPFIDSVLWATLMPFTSYVEEESISGAIPLLDQKNVASRQFLLGTSAMAYKYCSINPECESTQGVKDLSSKLKQLLGNKCHTENQEEDSKVLTVLKSFGNMGFVGESAKDILDCALTPENKVHIRIAAIEAFRRTPCKDEISQKLLDIYTSKSEHDELRIAALVSLSRCASRGIVKSVVETYSTETSRQVEVFTWSFLENIRSSSDPLKAKARKYLGYMSLKEPYSTDITKFSRNFESSFLSDIFNFGYGLEANIIHSSDSFLPRSSNLGLNLNLFGNQIHALEVGARVEDLEHILEKVFGPVGIFSVIDSKIREDLIQLLPETLQRFKRSADSYQTKIDALSERLGYNRNTVPRGTTYLRILGHELGLFHLNKESLKRVAGIKVNDLLKSMANLKDIDTSKNLLFIDLSVLFPSITGRAYKLASNGSLTLGLKADGKIDLRQPNFPFPAADIDGKFQPSILSEATAAFTIHSEDFEPGVKVETIFNAGLDYNAKIEVKDGRLFHLKINRENRKTEILNMKRTLYFMNHRGQNEMAKPDSYNLNYCTKYLQKIIGAKYCASLTFPHFYENGKFKIPFVRAMEASVSVEQTDPSMQGYEFLLEIPDFKTAREKRFKFLVDTPNSSKDRKLSIEVNVRHPNENQCTLQGHFYSPFYTLDINANMLNSEDKILLSAEAVGDKQRKYAVSIDAAKVVKGARLVEYHPKVSISSPTMRPVEFDGTLIFHKGRKEHLSINIESRSFGSPFLIKGRVAKEGEAINLSSNSKFSYEFNATAFEQIHRIHGGIGYIVNEGLLIDLGHHYEPDGRSYESITVNAMVKNIKIFDRLSFSIDSKILLAEHQDLNTMLKWDFSFKPWHHFKSDLEFRYGENFADDTHLVRMTVVQELHGDLNSFQKLNTDNKLGLTISCLGIDESAQLTAIWDFVDQPKLIFEAGIKTQKDKEVKIEFNYRHLEVEPLKLATDMIITFNTYKFKYSDEVYEIAPKEYKYKSIIEPVTGRMITSNFIYRIKSSDHVHHEFEGDIIFPGFSDPVQQKGYFQLSGGTFKLNSITDFGRNNKYIIDAELKRSGKNEIKLITPFIEGNLIVDASDLTKTVSADFRTRTKDDRRIVVAGTLTPGDTIAFDLDVEWDADRDSGKKVAINIKINKQAEEGINKHILITGSINYIGSIIVDISGKISADVIRGPHFFKAEFSGSMEPMAIEISHEIKDGHMNSVIRFLRRGVEKLRQDIKGKLIQRGFSHFETEFGIFSSSPFKAFDGKEIFFRLLFDSKDDIRSFISAYRIKLAEGLGYEGKVDYERKRGYPGHIRSNLAVTIHNRIIYEGTASVDYGNGKYSLKSSFTPISKKKIHFLASFEHAARFAAFHHSVATNFQYLQTVEVNAVADLRNMEDAKVHSDLGVNTHKLYDVNSTIKMRSMFDFEGEMTIFSKITPSFRIISKSQTSAQITKYDMNLDIDSKTVLTGSGELKKRKQKFNGDFIFKYKEKEILALTVNQDGKGKNERNYLIKLRFPSRLYTANVKINREKKGLVTYTTKFCRNEELCIEVDVVHKEYENGNEYVIKYKRDDVEFGIERIRESSNDEERFHTVVFNGNHRYGYDVKYGPGSFGPSLTLGLILPSREIYTKGTFKFSLSKPRVKLEFTADGKNNPDRTLATDIEFENHLNDISPSKFHIVITHPIFEKPIEMHLSGNYDSSTSKYFTSEASLDYSNDPNDKLIGKLSLERVSSVDEYSGQMVINTYHLDDQHLDFVIKVNLISNKNEDSFSIKYFWKKENGVDEEAHMIGSYLEKEKQFFFEYKRPKISYRLDGKIADPVSIFNNTWNVDLTSVYNGETTKAKLVTDGDCYKLMILDEEGDLSRIVELCTNMKSRKMVSLITESYNEDGKLTFDYLFEVIQSDWNTIRIRNQADPEFLGKYLFLLTSLGDELEEGGVGSLPFYESPQYKSIKRAFTSKVLDPAKNFLVSEGPKFFKDMENDATFLKNVAINYYKKLPPLHVIQEKSEKIRDYIGSVIKEIFSYYKSYFTTYLEYIDKFRSSVIEKCDLNSDCRSFVKSYQAEGFKGLLKEIRVFLLSLPERIIEFLENPSLEVQDYFKKSTDALKAFIEPLAKCKCGEIVVKVAKLSYETLKPRVQALMSRLPHHYRRIKETISSNEYIREAMELSKEMVIKLRERILNIDYQRLFIIARKYMEDYLSTLSPPSLKRVIKVNAISGEKGILDISIYSNVITRIINRIESVVVSIADMSVRAGRHFNLNSIMAKIKRGLDFGYIPPYKAHAMIVDHQHFVTFDKEFYDFAGECNYLLTRDFEDGNFTLVLKQNEGDKAASIIVIKDETSIELNSGQTEVKAGDNTIDLPFLSKDIEVTRLGNTVVVDTKNGLKVYCNLVHVICTFHMSGWYYGKTAGLLGTYNYEKYDEFKRPKGQIANSLPVFAKSWELKKGCKTANLLREIQVNKNSDFYKQCKLHFKDKKSPLAACFSEVSPESYFELCLKLLGKNTDSENSFCNAATAYVMECEKNYVDLNLPSKCLRCDAPDGSKKLEHGDRKKFEKLNRKSADIVFLVEDHDCNKVLLSDMNNLARSIEKELQNDGFRDIMFGLVGFDGSVGRPQTFTSKGNVFFGSRDMNSVAERLKLENKKSSPSRAFEAMKHAVEHHFRSYTTKSLVLLSCSSCKYDYTSLQYPVIQQILLERGVSLHIIRDIEIPIRKSTVKEKNIIGVDPNTVFHAKDVAQPDLVGEPELRSQIVVPKDLCITLSQDVNGSFFSTHPISKSSSEVKNWRSVFARRFLKSSQLATCQVCDCTATRDHVPSTVCQPCETKRPRLPFSVGSTGILARTMEAFLYPILILNLIGI